MISAEEMRVRLGLNAGDPSSDTLITSLILAANDYARTYCRLRDGEEVPDFLIAQMTAEDYGRLEGAGLSSRTVSGASEYYLHAYSSDILSILRSLRHPAACKKEKP